MPFLFFICFYFVFCVFCFRVCCVRLARQGHGKEHAARGRALHWECAPRRNSKQLCQLCQANSQTSTQIGEFSTRLSPKQLHNFKKNSRLYHATSPNISVQICQLFRVTFQNDFTILVPNSMCDLGTFVCIESRRLSPQFPRLSQNTCVTASLAYDPCHNHFFFESAPNTRLSRFSAPIRRPLTQLCVHLAFT